MNNQKKALSLIDEKKQKVTWEALCLLLPEFSEEYYYPSMSKGQQLIDQKAFEFIRQLASEKKLNQLTLDDIKNIHQKVCDACNDFRKLNDFDAYINSQYGAITVPSNLEIIVHKLPEKFIAWLNSSKEHTIIIAALAHIKLVTMHPFPDGNGRTAHLLMNYILLQGGYPPIAIDDSNRYFLGLNKTNSLNNFERLKVIDIQPNFEDFFYFICELVEKQVNKLLN